jgi:hypothetical protein
MKCHNYFHIKYCIAWVLSLRHFGSNTILFDVPASSTKSLDWWKMVVNIYIFQHFKCSSPALCIFARYYLKKINKNIHSEATHCTCFKKKKFQHFPLGEGNQLCSWIESLLNYDNLNIGEIRNLFFFSSANIFNIQYAKPYFGNLELDCLVLCGTENS